MKTDPAQCNHSMNEGNIGDTEVLIRRGIDCSLVFFPSPARASQTDAVISRGGGRKNRSHDQTVAGT